MMPRMFHVKQQFEGPTISDIPGAVREALARLDLGDRIRPGQTVALTAGSRGIVNIAIILRSVIDHLKGLGARPFIVPAMGSHGGATAEGQVEVLRHYGITEASMGAPIRSSMEVVQVGEALGLPVVLDRHAAAADHIGVIGRVKPHTDFSGEIESGLFKMMAIGLGKQRGAKQAHTAGLEHGYETVILAFGREILRRAPVAFGLGIVENGYDQTAKVAGLLPAEFEEGEKALLRDAKAWMARLPFDAIDLLIVDEMGKNVSGAGMDTNVIGRPFVQKVVEVPRVRRLFVRDLTPESAGNAVGIGFADFTTDRLVARIDAHATRMNALTSGAPDCARIPIAFATDREAIEAALTTIGLTPPERARVVRIKNTLLLAELEASEAFVDEVRSRPSLSRGSDPAPMGFDLGGNLPPF